MRRGARLLERLGHDDRDGLVVVLDLGAAQQQRSVEFALAELAGILRRDDGDHAGRGFGSGEIHRDDAALGDGRADDVAIGLVRHHVVPIVGIGRGAGRLERAVDAVDGLADDLQLVDGIGGGGRVEFHESAFRFGEDGGERALHQRHLECVVVRRARAGEQPGRDRLGAARQLALGGLHAPRLVRHAAQCHAAGAVALHDRGDGDQREGVGGAVAHLAIDVRRRRSAWAASPR